MTTIIDTERDTHTHTHTHTKNANVRMMRLETYSVVVTVVFRWQCVVVNLAIVDELHVQ